MERFNACVQCKTKEVHFKHIECTLSVLPDEHKKITILYIYIYIYVQELLYVQNVMTHFYRL